MLLQQPGQLGALRLKNRVIMAPIGTNFSTGDGIITERDKHYYRERAQSGVALIMTGAMGVTGEGRAHRYTPVCHHDRYIPGLASLVETIKAHECYVFAEINHHGALLHEPGMPPVGPSPWTNPKTGEAVKAMSVAEIAHIETQFALAARRLWIAGYDGVEIHAANGYLFQQFLTPRINKRTDRYGGGIQNRMRLLLETVARIHDLVPDMPVSVRISIGEFCADSYTQADVIELAQALAVAGVVALDLSAGSNESPQLSKYAIQPPSFARGWLAPYAKAIKQAVSLPIILAGRLVEPADAEAVLACGSADFVSLGRALFADPHWCLKAFGKVRAPIRACIACNVCHDRLSAETDVSCVQNPLMGTEFESLAHAEPQTTQARTALKQRVLILGAGIAGIEAARVAAGRGHDVEIWERTARTGGQMQLATVAPFKREVQAVWDYRWQQIAALEVPVRTSIEADVERVRAFRPDLVIVATGASPQPLEPALAPPDSRVPAHSTWTYLAAPELIASGSRVTVIGDGTDSAECADLLASRGCKVTVFVAGSVLAPGIAKTNRRDLMERLDAAHAEVLVETKVLRRLGDALEWEGTRTGRRTLPLGDHLLIAPALTPNLEVLAVLDTVGVPYVTIGDCNQLGDFMSCLRDAAMVGLAIDRYARRR